MCGIAGTLDYSERSLPASAASEMLERLDHRGPDQWGHKEIGSLSLGMVRLSIVDQKHHQLPYSSPEGQISLAYNGEIYNEQDFACSGSWPMPREAQVMIENYQRKGVASFADYNGMFALALYDQAIGRLFLVRDKCGEKPLYYHHNERFFAFASEIKSLLSLVPAQFNDNCLAYQAYEFSVGRETLFKDIYALEPGEYLELDLQGALKRKNYWSFWEHLYEVPDDLPTIENTLSELLEDSILLRTKNMLHEYGVFVSGGVDSALVASIAKPDHLYTCHYPIKNDYDELAYAKLLAERLNKPLTLIEPSVQDFQRTREDLIYHLDTPCTWTSFSLWMLLERACRDVKVVLSGDGADELFCGYHRYHLLHHDEQVRHIPAMKQYKYLIDRYYGPQEERYARLVNRCEDAHNFDVFLFVKERVRFYFERMNGDYVHGMGLCDFYTTMQELLHFADRVNMAFGVENRSPFLDERLVRFAFSMPSKYKIKDGTSKWILKKVARKFIPHEIADRVDKRGFSAPINHWFSWVQNGKYDRSFYKNMVFNDWLKAFHETKVSSEVPSLA